VLGVGVLCLRQGPKGPVLEALQRRLGLSPAVTVAMGDDLPDLALFARAAVGVCPADAVPEVRAAAHWVCGAPGGHGAVRELCELLLRAQGRWEGLLAEAAR
jgi:3-deoxy-D-manno-octulosonate 8-phosphate phosphatase (KDO 8-P phosphatase)